MAYTKNRTIDYNPSGTTVRNGVLYCDLNIDDLVSNLNTHEALTTGCHGVSTAGVIVGTTDTQTLTNKTLSSPVLTGTVTASGATITGGTISSVTLAGTITSSGATLTGTLTATNATITGGTISTPTILNPTLTGTVTASSATITGTTLSNPTITGTVGASGGTIQSPTITGATITNSTIGSSNTFPTSSESTAGIAEIATQAEVNAGTDDERIVTPKKLLDTPMIYRKNVVINGDMLVWQRGTTFANVPGGAYTADRWQIVEATDAVVTLTKSTDVPTAADAGGSFAASLKLDVTTADTSIGSTQECCLQTMIEGYDIRGLTSGNVTMSFWVKATKTGTYCVVLRNAGADRVYPVEYTINNTGTWEKKTIVIPLNTGVASGTWNYTNGIGLTIRFIIAAGSSYANGTNATWGTAGAGGTSNQVNGLDSTDNDFYITGVQLEKGSVATDFEFRSFADELRLCMRYYEKSAPYGTVPGSNGDSRALFQGPIGNTYINIPFCVRKRAVGGTIKVWSTESPYTVAKAYDYTASAETNLSGTAFEGHMELIYSQTATNHLYGCTWSVESEL